MILFFNKKHSSKFDTWETMNTLIKIYQHNLVSLTKLWVQIRKHIEIVTRKLPKNRICYNFHETNEGKWFLTTNFLSNYRKFYLWISSFVSFQPTQTQYSNTCQKGLDVSIIWHWIFPNFVKLIRAKTKTINLPFLTQVCKMVPRFTHICSSSKKWFQTQTKVSYTHIGIQTKFKSQGQDHF